MKTLDIGQMWKSIEAQLQNYKPEVIKPAPSQGVEPIDKDVLKTIVEILRTKTRHDFTLYKSGTLQRRISRRMGLLTIDQRDVLAYIALLNKDQNEVDNLAKDLLIHITRFFRDPDTFDYLAKDVIPDIIENHKDGKPIRLWIAGCSTGEEAYSLAILFLEAIRKAGYQIKLQIFASDIDQDSIGYAREGHYAKTIEDQISPDRLNAYFNKEDRGYRVKPDMRECVVFTVQDVLSDPPFSRLDLVSCRNVLIYLSPEAQARIIALFHFSLKPDGLLLLGSAETIGQNEDAFIKLTKSERLYKRTGNLLVPALDFSRGSIAQLNQLPLSQAPNQKIQMGGMEHACRNKLTELFAPAAILINAKDECLFSFGLIGNFVSFRSGLASFDLMNMVSEDLSSKLRVLIGQCKTHKTPQSSSAKRIDSDGMTIAFEIKVVTIEFDGETFWLICFIDHKEIKVPSRCPVLVYENTSSGLIKDCERVEELEQELATTRIELKAAIHNLELSSEDQRAINEEALSVNEEYQSTNEELLTSKEELQSLNEELTALNAQLQESLDIQRTLASDLKNILYSTDVATLFLDMDLKIRFFTPSTKSLFNILPIDVGRPLSDLNSLAMDVDLERDAHHILTSLDSIELEIHTNHNQWFLRRILPYRGRDNAVEGVVVTFVDITERKANSEALERAKLSAEQANKAKSRFLAAASHDLRQPLQSLALLQGLLAQMAQGDGAQKLVARLDVTLESMSTMLNTLLDINHFETGMIEANKVYFSIDEMLTRLRDEFNYYAQARTIKFRVVSSHLMIHSDPALLEQMLRNFLSNAFKYTQQGTILLGCRRKKDHLSFEVWDQGIGIPETELLTIFDEYHQVNNQERQRSLGLGLGLSIVKRLGNLLGHTIEVRSIIGKGSVFSIDLDRHLSQDIEIIKSNKPPQKEDGKQEPALVVKTMSKSQILVIEDDPLVREILELILNNEGHEVLCVADGFQALEALSHGDFLPDLILSDFNLPKGMNGLETMRKIREQQNRTIPVIILTGDISTYAMREIAAEKCIQLSKPVKLDELNQSIKTSLLHIVTPVFEEIVPTIEKNDLQLYVVDDDDEIRQSIRAVFEAQGMTVHSYESAEAFIDAYVDDDKACVLIDAYLPGMDGLELIKVLRAKDHAIPVIMMTGNSDVTMAVKAMKSGALDFLEKPIGFHDLIHSVTQALDLAKDTQKKVHYHAEALSLIKGLTTRQREIMDRVLKGEPSKNIAADLGISQRTVENHRAAIMAKTGMKSLPALARLSLAAQ